MSIFWSIPVTVAQDDDLVLQAASAFEDALVIKRHEASTIAKTRRSIDE